MFDDTYTRWGPIQWMPPETLLTLLEHLGRSETENDAAVRGNILRVAETAWRT